MEVPKLSKGNVQRYLNELKEWQVRTEVERSKQGLIVWLDLPNEDSKHIKRLILDHISIADLTKDDGMDKLIEALKEVGQQEEETEASNKRKSN